jgi:hypothetical protein
MARTENADDFIDAGEVAGAHPAVVDGNTHGVSPKAVLAFLYPTIATLAAVLGSWIVTGQWNEAETRTAIAGLVASAVAALGAAVGRTGKVQQ